jgi:hypothetical protein
MNSAGDVGASATFGKPADWCGFFGRRSRTDHIEGIAIFNHPENFGGDCPWFTRDYGHLSPSPFSFVKSPWSLDRGATLNLRYCVVLHTGTPRDVDLNSVYRQWIHDEGMFIALRSASQTTKPAVKTIMPADHH